MHVSFDERSHKLDTLPVQSFERFGVGGRVFVDQRAPRVVGGRGGHGEEEGGKRTSAANRVGDYAGRHLQLNHTVRIGVALDVHFASPIRTHAKLYQSGPRI